MQTKIKQFAEKHLENASVFALFNRAQFEANAYALLSKRDFYARYKSLFVFALLLSFVAQIASLISEIGYFSGLLAVKLSGLTLSAASIVAVLLLEIAKYYILNRLLADIFSLAGVRIAWGLLFAAIAISAISVYASVCGGGDLAVDKNTAKNAGAQWETEIAIVRAEIADIKKRNTWKGSTWIAGADKKLLQQKESLLTDLIAKRNSAIDSAINKEQANVTTYRYAFACFELVFFACTLFVWYFKKRVAIEAHIDSDSTNTSFTRLDAQKNEPKPANRIGFTFGWQKQNENRNNENRICKHCNKSYVHKHHKQLYCSENCRIAAWELRTGKPFNKVKK